MLTRRTFTQAAAVACAGAPLVARAQAPITLRFATFQPPTSYTWTQMLKPWMDKVERDSNGRIKFEGYPAMQLGGTAAQLYDQARDGVADVVWTLPGYSAGRFPRMEVFELPFMMTNAEATSKAVWEYVQAHAADEFRETKLLAMHVHGPGVLHTQKPVLTANDLRGQKVRGPTRQVTRLLGVLGATPVGMLLPQIPDALSKGTIEGCVLNWEVVPAVKVHELTKFHGEFPTTGPALYTTSFMMTMNRAKYDGLPADLRQVIDANSGLALSGHLGKTQQAGDAAGRKLAQDRGNQIHTYTEAETQGFVRQSARVVDEWVQEVGKRGADGNALLKTARDLIAKHGRA
jgi:TRAP-type C4-dicarboxylate transport system substrate-binding protein